MVDSRFSLTNVQAKSSGGLGRVDDGRTCRDQVLQVVHERHALAKACSTCLRWEMSAQEPTISERLAGLVTHDPERVLDPDVVSVSVPEPVLDGPSALLDERSHFVEQLAGHRPDADASTRNPILEHLPGEKPMIGSTFWLTKVQAYSPEAWLVYMMPGVTVSRYWNRSRASFSSVVRSSTRFSSSSYAFWSASCSRLRSRMSVAKPTVPISSPSSSTSTEAEIKNRNAAAVLGPKHAFEPGNGAAALAHLAQDFVCPRLAAVEHAHAAADNVFGLIAQQRLGALVEQYDLSFLVGGDDGVGRTLDQAGQRLLRLLQLELAASAFVSASLAVGNVGPGADELQRTSGIVIDDPESVVDPDVAARSGGGSGIRRSLPRVLSAGAIPRTRAGRLRDAGGRASISDR